MKQGIKYNLIYLLILLLLSCNTEQNKTNKKHRTKKSTISYYAKNRAEFKTKLIKEEKAPQFHEEFSPINGSVKLVYYPSDSLKLKALIDTTNITSKPKKVLVYLHGGFALGYGDLDDCKTFIDNDFIVFAPTYRGENGNKGNYELLLGEVEDVKSSIKWLSKQSYINKDSIFVFGHSIGGAMSLAVSFCNDIPINKAGSSAGIYDKSIIEYWAKEEEIVPFDYQNETELYYRLPVYALNELPRQHYMYIGEDDDYTNIKNFVNQLYKQKKTNLKLIKVKGDHFSSLEKAVQLFINEIHN